MRKEKAEVFGITSKKLDGKSITLSRAPNQKVLKVTQIMGDGELCSQIAEIGISPGSLIQVRRIGSSCLVRVGTKRHTVSLDRKVSDRIMVQ